MLSSITNNFCLFCKNCAVNHFRYFHKGTEGREVCIDVNTSQTIEFRLLDLYQGEYNGEIRGRKCLSLKIDSYIVFYVGNHGGFVKVDRNLTEYHCNEYIQLAKKRLCAPFYRTSKLHFEIKQNTFLKD